MPAVILVRVHDNSRPMRCLFWPLAAQTAVKSWVKSMRFCQIQPNSSVVGIYANSAKNI